MYKFVGGFINTLKPYDDDIVNRKLIITKEFLNNITYLIK